MNKKLLGVLAAISVVGGVAAGFAAHALTKESGPTDEVARPAALDLATFRMEPGRVGPGRIGMSKAEALDLGLFEADVDPKVDGCEIIPLQWKAPLDKVFDVQTLGNGEIVSVATQSPKVSTDQGVGVGSTLREVERAYPDAELGDAGYAQSGITVFDGQTGGWIGFLFPTAPDKTMASTAVQMVEVTKGAEPGLMRDGC